MANISGLQSELAMRKRDKESYQRDYDRAAAKLRSNPSDTSAEHERKMAEDRLRDVDDKIKRIEDQIRTSV